MFIAAVRRGLAGCCVLVLAATLCAKVAAAKAQRPMGARIDRIVAVVDEDIITAFELEQKAASHMEALPKEPDRQAHKRARRAVLERVLDEEITERLLQREGSSRAAEQHGGRDGVGVSHLRLPPECVCAETLDMSVRRMGIVCRPWLNHLTQANCERLVPQSKSLKHLIHALQTLPHDD